MEAAMEFLAETDDPYAQAKAGVLRAEILTKRVRSRVFLVGSGSVESRKAEAEGHPDVIEADESLCAATLAFETLKAKRSRAEILIDVYRTLEASRRRL
jgi:hypothetical protein